MKKCRRSSKLKKQIFDSFVWQMTEMVVYQNCCRFIFLRSSRRCSSDVRDTRERRCDIRVKDSLQISFRVRLNRLLCADRKLWFCFYFWLQLIGLFVSTFLKFFSSHCDALIDGKRLHSVTDQSLAELNQTDFHWCRRSSWLIMTQNISTF